MLEWQLILRGSIVTSRVRFLRMRLMPLFGDLIYFLGIDRTILRPYVE